MKCKHRQPGPLPQLPDIGICAIGVVQHPSAGFCRQCPKCDPLPQDETPAPALPQPPPAAPAPPRPARLATPQAPAKPPCGCKKLVNGAVGLAKAAAGIGTAPEEVIEARRAICRTCPKGSGDLSGRCSACGCWIKPKTMLAGERCPEGRWEAFTPTRPPPTTGR